MRAQGAAPSDGLEDPPTRPDNDAVFGGVVDSPADTIVAVSTPVGSGAIGIVRLTGHMAADLCSKVFVRPSRPFPDREDSHRLVYGHIVDPLSGATLDEVLVAVMYAPATYTREDMVEVHCHGGPAAQRAILRLFIEQGARPAEPGEFTKRAFLSGRLDLAQAESVASVIRARTTSSLRAAVHQLGGGLSREVSAIRAGLIGVLAEVEAAVDFADEDVDDLDRGDCAARMAVAGRSLQDLLDTAFVGRILDEGLRTAIVGRPNVGKSSLLNRLVRRERAIVSEVPGTTRDTVEEMVEFAGVPVVLIDTAGIRVSEDVVEQLGVERSRVALEAADLVLVIVDLCAAGRWSEEMFPAEVEWFLRGLDPARTVIVGNKVDIAPQGSAERLAAWAAEAGLGGGPWRACSVSASTGRGVDELRAIIDNLIAGADGIALEEPMVSTERQRTFVAQAVGSARRAEAGLAAGSPEELVAEDIRAAAQALGAITGEELNESLIDEIFSRFCVGK